jgi:hypothetical protein
MHQYGKIGSICSLYFKADLTTGTGINAIGYNALDNALCGILLSSPPQGIRLGARGEVVAVRTLTGTASYNVGDVDESGQLWVAQNGREWV